MASKWLGLASAKILHSLHSTVPPPSNAVLLRDWNALTGARVRLGRCDRYLALRGGGLPLTVAHRQRLSNELGAAAALLHEKPAPAA